MLAQLALSNADEHLRKKLEPTEINMSAIQKLKEKAGLVKKDNKPIHKHRKAKGPNPLSCKKSKNKKPQLNSNKNNNNNFNNKSKAKNDVENKN